MSFEALILLVFFIVLPLLERLMKMLREKQGTPADAEEMPRPAPRRPRPASRQPPRPPVGSRPSRPRPPRAQDAPAPRREAPAAWSEAQSLETAAAREGLAVREDATGLDGSEPAAERPVLTPAAERSRPRFRIRNPVSLRAAVVAQTVLGPCRAMRPYDGPDI